MTQFVQSVTKWFATGWTGSVTTGQLPQTIWTGTGLMPDIAIPGPVSLSSTSAADTATGTGSRAVLIHGIDPAGGWIEEIIPTAGLATATGQKNFAQVNEIFGVSTGSGKKNAGTITITRGVTCGIILPGHRRAGFCRTFAVSDDYTALVGVTASMFKQGGGDAWAWLAIETRPLGGEWQTIQFFGISTSTPLPNPIQLGQRLPFGYGLRINVVELSISNCYFAATLELARGLAMGRLT